MSLDVVVSRGFDRVAANPIRWALGSLALGVLLGGTLESLIETGQSMPDGWWWAFVSMTTVGYGDISPHTDVMRFVALFVISTGIAAVAICTAALGGRIAERRIVKPHQMTPEIDDDLLACIERMQENMEDLQRLVPLVQHPRVVEALRSIQSDQE